MTLFDILLGKKKKTQYVEHKSSTTPPQHPAARKPNSIAQSKSLPKKQPDAGRSALQPLDSYALEQGAFQDQTCKNNSHDFVRPYPLTCRKCGLTLQWDSDSIGKYMGSYFEDLSYQWTPFMDSTYIESFSISVGDRPVFEASCDFTHLCIRNCLHGSRDTGTNYTDITRKLHSPATVYGKHLRPREILSLGLYAKTGGAFRLNAVHCINL